MSNARKVALEALRVLRMRGVHDVADRLEARVIPEGHEDEPKASDEVARAAIGELELRGLHAIAVGLKTQLGTLQSVEVPAPAPAGPVAPKAKPAPKG